MRHYDDQVAWRRPRCDKVTAIFSFDQDAVALAQALGIRGVTAEAIVRSCLDRIAAREPLIGAWAHVDPAAAIAAARAADEGQPRGPLHGLPIGIKDVILTRDMPTRYNCDLYADAPPTADAACVTLLRQAGALILGKTETVELASIGRPARTRNPHARDHTPGGSSSGSAAAVADGHVPVALGTQTGGSIIRPASFCGVWALKPSWGTVSTEGAKPFAPSLDTIGWFARSPRDLAMLLDLFDPPATAPEPAPELARTRIAVWRTAGWPQAGAATRDALAAAVALLRDSGACVTELDLPRLDGLARAQTIVMLAEGRRSFLAEYRADAASLHPRIAEMVRTAGGFTAADLREAHDIAAAGRAEFDRIAGDHDAVLAPSTIAEAPAGLAATGDLLFNGLFTLLHVPCVNMPLFAAANGLPVGLTLTGPRYADRKIVAIAERIDAARSNPPDHRRELRSG